MTPEQAWLLILLIAMLVLFLIDRFRVEVVAIAGLLAGYALGLYPTEAVFSGFASPVVITVVEILLVVQVLARTRFFDRVSTALAGRGMRGTGVIAILSGVTGFISIFMNNIGAFSISLPVALRISSVTAIPKRQLIMPISFAALFGGLVSLIGTPANLLVSNALVAATGQGFRLFDFAYVGLPVAITGILMTSMLAPLLFPRDGDDDKAAPETPRRRMVAERRVPAGSPLIGQNLADLPARFALKPHALLRNGAFVFGSADRAIVEAGDLLLAEADDAVLADFAASGALQTDHWQAGHWQAEASRVEAVVMPESTLVGSRLRSLEVFSTRNIAISALSMRSPRIEGRFEDLQLSIGDVLVLEGDRAAIAEALEECECLPLASPPVPPSVSLSWQPFAIFACGIAATTVLRPDIALAGVVLVLALLNYLNIRQAMADLNWPVIIMLAAMIPIGSAVGTSGTAEVIASALGTILPVSQPLAGIAVVLFLAIALTPFINNATVAIILSPIAIEFAAAGEHQPQAYLLAVALGASLDFLTPFGHHNNTLAMGIGSYRFSDFIRAGLPVTVLSYFLSLLLLYVFWV
ncbi:SLC13 family permease [Rhizobium sp. AN80A]|uniref:SLC13 family permease n=1 Tax=Rhizobium sp. AN80A TaxID=3040673 RepID=UPI0024B377A9|nr:SLC13 family permease [Rhizobium sp. AN80A]